MKHNNYSWAPASFVSLSALLSTSTISAIDSEIKLTYKAFSKSSSKHWDKIWVCSLTRILEKSFHSGYTRANLKKLYFSFTDGAAISDQNWSHPFDLDLDLDLGRGSIARSRSAKSDQTIKSISISNRSPQVWTLPNKMKDEKTSFLFFHSVIQTSPNLFIHAVTNNKK